MIFPAATFSALLVAFVLERRGKSLLLIVALAFLAVLNAAWALPLFGIGVEPGSLPPLLSDPRPTSVLVVGHLIAVALLLAAAGLFSPRAGSFADLAHRAERRGDFQAAGEAWLQAGHERRALRAFLKARTWVRAAEVARARGNTRQAAELYAREGGEGLLVAAQLLSGLGEDPAAVDLWRRYAQFAVTSGRPEAAIEPFSRAGEARRALHAVELALQGKRLGPDHIEPALRAAREARHLHLAARIAALGGRYREAGDLYLAAEEPEEAARMFERAGDQLRAAEALRLAGKSETAAKLRARQLAASGQFELAADEFDAAGMHAEAAEIYARLGRWQAAVDRYRKCGRERDAAVVLRNNGAPREAAEVLEGLDEWAEAADCWASADEPLRAAACFEKAGDTDRALDILAGAGLADEQARLLARLDRIPEAITLVVQRGDFSTAWEILAATDGTFPELADPLQHVARWLRAQGRTREAISAMQRVIGGRTVTRELIAAHYTLADLFEVHGDLRAAETLWQRIVDIDYAYRDASQRLAEVTAKRQREAAIQAGATVPIVGEPGSAADPAAKRYTLEKELGRGGMGIVYRARDTRLHRTVAIKILDARQLTPDSLRRFEREARAAAALSHPGIVHIYDFAQGLGSYYISMEYVPGLTLAQLVREEPDTVKHDLLLLMSQICEAVAYAHSRHVVHRDLKPSNMVFAERRQVKILDFGIARRLDDKETTGSGVTGTPFYMAPEQIVGEEPDERSDVYSLGVTFFQLATGAVPFATGNVLRAHLEQPAPDPCSLVPDLSVGVRDVILACLAKNPADRPRNGSELADAVRAAEGDARS